MYITAFLVAVLGTLAAGTPIPGSNVSKKPYIAISLDISFQPPKGHAYISPGPTPLYKLRPISKPLKYITKLEFESDYAFGVPGIDSVECQAYSDILGQDPIGAFTNLKPLVFDEPTAVGNWICYVRDVDLTL